MPLEDSAILRENPVIKCESVYKIFGDNAEKMLQDAKREMLILACFYDENEVLEGLVGIILGTC